MLDYSKASIYKIVCNISGKIYIGSTCQPLHQRLGGHVASHKRGAGCASSQIIEAGNYSIILIEEYQCENKQQLLRKERNYIDSMDCVNKYRPIVSKEEAIAEKQEYYQLNKDSITIRKKQHYQNNRETILQKANEYQSKKVNCSICNKEMRKDNLTKHKRKIHKPDYTLIE
jgi:hypothetical protein